LPDVPGFTEPTDPGLVTSGNVYTTTIDGWIVGLRVYIPVIGADLPYQADVYEILDEGPPRVLRLLLSVPIPANSTGTGWIDLTLPADILTLVGAQIAIILAASNTAGEVEVLQAPWVLEGQINVGNPPLGDWNYNNADTTVRLNDVDDDAVDQSTPLATVIAGDIIRFTSQLTGVSWNYVASGPGVPAAGVFAFPVVRGSGTGTINPLELCDVLILREGVGPATYDVLADHWLGGGNDPTWATVQGVLNLTQEQDPAE
jgi:hypothetical protein